MEAFMMKRLSVAEAKATFSERIRDVESGEPILITRHGRPVAALVRAEDAEQLERLRASGPEGGLASLAGGWEDSDDLARILSESHRLGQRVPPVLE
jgi:prevent-host-death family protein